MWIDNRFVIAIIKWINIFKCYNFITNMVNVYKHIINAFRDPQ